MPCVRCGGFMIAETVGALLEKESWPGRSAARCVNCGNFEDSIIRANRNSHCLSRRFGEYTDSQGIEKCSAKLVATGQRRFYE
jgi:ribosomal protein S14